MVRGSVELHEWQDASSADENSTGLTIVVIIIINASKIWSNKQTFGVFN